MRHLKLYKNYKINEGLLTTTVLTAGSIYFLIRFFKDFFLDLKVKKGYEKVYINSIIQQLSRFPNDSIIVEEDDTYIIIKFISPRMDAKVNKITKRLSLNNFELSDKMKSMGVLNDVPIDDNFIRNIKRIIKIRDLK